MYQRVKAYVEEQHMLEKKDRVIVGVSGGADSVCLLFVLTKLRDERQKSGDGTLEITAVHVHHGLRGDSADADERYVRKICDAWNVPLVVYHKNIRELAKCWNMSEEEAGRKARREAFLELRNARLGDILTLDDGLVGLHTSHHIIGLDGQNLLQRVGSAVRLQSPHLHLTETLSAELGFTAQGLLRYQGVWAGGTGILLSP